MEMLAVYTTHKDMNNAEKVTNHLFNLKLIACVNYFPIESVYVWKWGLEKSNEIVAIYKTKPQNWISVKEAIKATHPYRIPCIMEMPVDVNSGYGNRIINSTV